MESREIAERLGRYIDVNHFGIGANRNIYPLSVVNLVGSYLGKGNFREQEEERIAFLDYLQSSFFQNLNYYSGTELKVKLGDPSDWSGPFVLPVFTHGALAYLKEKGIPIEPENFFPSLAIESLRPENDKLLKAIRFFGPEVLFWRMTGANQDYTTLTKIETEVDWLKRFNLFNPQSRIVIKRTSNPDYVRDLESILGEDGKRAILEGDCLQTLSMYEHLLRSPLFYNDPEAEIVHEECEANGGSSCVYRLSFKPKHNILMQALGIIREGLVEVLSGSDVRQQLFDSENTAREKNAQLRRTQLLLEDRNKQLQNALVALRSEYEGRDEDFVRTRKLLGELSRGPIHDAKNGFKGILPQVVTCQDEILKVLIRKYESITIDERLIDPLLSDLESYLQENDPQTLKRIKIDKFRERLRQSTQFSSEDLDILNINYLRPLFYSVISDRFNPEDRLSFDSIKSALYSVDSSCTSNCRILTDMILDPSIRENPVDVPIISVVEDLERRCRLLFQDRSFDFQINLDPINLNLRKSQVEFAINNLLKNAAEATPSGGRVSVVLDRDPEYVLMRITNPGRIPEEILENLLRGVPTKSSKEFSTGSGTSQARETLLIHGGSLDFRNLDNGTVEVEVKLKI